MKICGDSSSPASIQSPKMYTQLRVGPFLVLLSFLCTFTILLWWHAGCLLHPNNTTSHGNKKQLLVHSTPGVMKSDGQHDAIGGFTCVGKYWSSLQTDEPSRFLATNVKGNYVWKVETGEQLIFFSRLSVGLHSTRNFILVHKATLST